MPIRIDGDNATATPGITGGDADTGLVFGTDEVSVVTGGTEQAKVDSSGRLLVGTSSDLSSGETNRLIQAATSSGAFILLSRTDASITNNEVLSGVEFRGNGNPSASIYAWADGDHGASDYPGRLVFSTTKDGQASPTEAARIDSSQRMLMGKIAISFSTDGLVVGPDAIGDANGWHFSSTSTATTTTGGNIATNQKTSGAWFLKGHYNGTEVGGVRLNGTTGTSFPTTSDYRLKENVIPLAGALERLGQLSVHRFNFIAEPSRTVDGFLAHEVESIVPEAVCGVKDAVDDQGKIIPQGIDQSKLVPLLTAALQEAVAKIETLEAKVAALEANP